METAFSLGSNLGDRLENLQAARSAMLAISNTVLVAQSPVYETEPVGVRPEHQDKLYLNCVLVIEAPLSPEAWLWETRRIETALGRRREADRNAPRRLDIDLLYSGSEQRHSTDLELPHPRWAQRRFVVQPLADCRPHVVLPGSELSVAACLKALPDTEAVSVFCIDW